MADYYPLLARSIAEMGPEAVGEQRRALYERARIALIRQLREVEPRLSESTITRERLTLEEAVRRVEAEAAQRARQASQSPREKHPSLLTRDDLERQRIVAEFARIQKAEEAAREARFQSVDEKTPSIPPIATIPQQDLTKGMGFSASRRGPLDIIPDAHGDRYDPEQSLLYRRIRDQLRRLKEDIPSQERSQVNQAIDDFLSQPEDWSSVEFKKVLWLCGNSLRALLAQSDAVNSDPEHYAKLPPSVAEALRSPVQAWSIFAQGDSTLAQLDHYSLGPKDLNEVRKSLQVGLGFVARAVENNGVLTERAAASIDAMFAAVESKSDDINTRLGQELADRTFRNLLTALLRRAYLLREAIVGPKTIEAQELVNDLAKGVTIAAGGLAITSAPAITSFALPYLEFVASHPSLLRDYILVAFQNQSLVEIVSAIEYDYRRLRMNFSGTRADAPE